MADEDNYPKHVQNFDVVMLRKADGVHALNATTADFKRIMVTAASPVEAMMDATVEAQVKAGYTVIHAMPPGVMSESELLARRREMDPPTDRSKI